MSARLAQKPRAHFYWRDSGRYLERLAKMQRQDDPTDGIAQILLRLHHLGHLGTSYLKQQEQRDLILCAHTKLCCTVYTAYWPVEHHHLDGDRSNNHQDNLALIFQPTHQALTDIRYPSGLLISRHLRRKLVATVWHQLLRGQGEAGLWLPDLYLPPAANDNADLDWRVEA